MHRPMLLAAVMGLAVAVMLGSAPASSAQMVRQDSVTGTGETDPSQGLTTTFVLDAHSGASGEAPSGTIGFDEDRGLLTAGGVVTCLAVGGNTAVIGYGGTASVDHGTFTSPIFGFIRVVDGGGPGSSLDRFAEVGATPIGPAPTDCSLAPAASELLTVIRGDIAVHDALPPPTSKDQCKNGGFAQFGFKNEGQCVAFVERGSKG